MHVHNVSDRSIFWLFLCEQAHELALFAKGGSVHPDWLQKGLTPQIQLVVLSATLGKVSQFWPDRLVAGNPTPIQGTLDLTRATIRRLLGRFDELIRSEQLAPESPVVLDILADITGLKLNSLRDQISQQGLLCDGCRDFHEGEELRNEYQRQVRLELLRVEASKDVAREVASAHQKRRLGEKELHRQIEIAVRDELQVASKVTTAYRTVARRFGRSEKNVARIFLAAEKRKSGDY